MTRNRNSTMSAEEELAALKKKFAEWKAKAKAGVDEQRAHMLELQRQLEASDAAAAEHKKAAEAATDARVAVEAELQLQQRRADDDLARQQLEVEVITRRHDTACAAYRDVGMRSMRAAMAVAQAGTAAAQQQADAAMRAGAQVASLRGELNRVQGDFDKFKERSARTLQLTSTNVDDLSAQAQRAEEGEAAAKHAMTELQATLAVKDRTIASLEHRLQDAAKAMHALQERNEELAELADMARGPASAGGTASMPRRHASDEELANAVEEAVEAAHADAQARFRDELDASAQAHRDELQSRDIELVRLRMRVAQLTAAGGASANDDDGYVRTLQDQLGAARKDVEAARMESRQLEQQVHRLRIAAEAAEKQGHAAVPTPSTDLSCIAMCSPEELRRQLAIKSEQLWDANQQLLQLRATLRSASSAPASQQPASEQQLLYQRAIVLRLLTAGDDRVRASLIPVVATLLNLSTEELRAVYEANPDWAVM